MDKLAFFRIVIGMWDTRIEANRMTMTNAEIKIVISVAVEKKKLIIKTKMLAEMKRDQLAVIGIVKRNVERK